MAKLFLGTKESSPVVKETIYLPKEKCGLTIDNFIGDMDEEGTLSGPDKAFSEEYIFDGVKTIAAGALNGTFRNNENVKKISFPDLETISGNKACFELAMNALNLETFEVPKLEVIDGDFGYALKSAKKLKEIKFPSLRHLTKNGSMKYFCNECSGVELIDMSSLEIIEGDLYEWIYNLSNVLEIRLDSLRIHNPSSSNYVFENLSKIKKIDFPSLEEFLVPGQSFVYGSFSSLEEINFPKLTVFPVNGFSSQMFQSGVASRVFDIHFRADVREQIESMPNYANKFGATKANIFFDL